MRYIKTYESFDNIESHLKGRGIDPSKTRVIISEDEGDVYFFLYNLSGQVVGYQKYNPSYDKKGQKDSNDRRTKYYNWVTEEGRDRMIAVWGLESYDFKDKYLFITEGIFDIARVHQAGYPGVAVLCNDPSSQLRNWLATLPQIKIVIYDNDKAGKKLISLGDHSYSVETGKDLNDLSREDAKVFLDDIISKIENGG
jgi:hypothetical protein